MNPLYKNGLREIKKLSKAAFRHTLYRLHGLVHETVTINTPQGRLTIPTRDSGISEPLFRNRQYELDFSLRALHFLKINGMVPSEKICMLDVGANIGIISIGLLLANEIQYSISIEPEPKSFALLKKNINQNGLSERVACLQIAAGESSTTLTMELSSTNMGDHRIRSTPVPEATEIEDESNRLTVQIPCLPLDKILRKPELQTLSFPAASLLWMDVQGYEGCVISGGKDFLGRGIPMVSEVWPYGILRAGMSLDKFTQIMRENWTDYWVERRQKFTRYPIAVFDRYLDELGTDGHYENVIFTTMRAK